ncbi:MAG TPA: glycoside hydrolase family 38 C-terminal domain-containing protein [Acidimicrobiales bacterium]|nr:glycoside hydrolase family 38 C-terminal domain-containing protein [Acidimicrobiales bacterium]
MSILGRARALLAEVVAPAVFGPTAALEVAARHLPGEPLPYDEAVTGPFQPFDLGGRWGPRWGTTWFRLRGEVPPAWAGEEVALRLEMTEPAEALLWRDGVPLVGLSWLRRDALLWKKAEALEAVELFVEAAANPAVPRFVVGDDWPLLMPDPGGDPGFELLRCQLALRRPEVYALACDLRTVLELAEAVDAAGGPTDFVLLEALAAMFAAVDPDDVAATAGEGRQALSRALDRRADPGAHRISAVGHAHIDTAWLWPMREAARKCARSFANAVTLMEDYPAFEFVASAARHLAWVEDRYPPLFARIAERVATGQFRPAGGMWVEADCNMPAGESLVRQLVHGQRWYLGRFGQECTESWLPDGFGFPASLPQILAEAGIGWFVTQKLCWNEVNRFPHHTFWWQGLDGTRIRAHFPPADTYNGTMALPELLRGAGAGPRSLYPFGYGDGGGGPTRDMIEAALRAADLAGAPRVALESHTDFFAAVEADPTPLPVWAGDLYLEKHRGTFTSQAAVKAGNRRGELALAAAELWSTVRPDGAPWPAGELDRAWKLLLVNQFHDVLPGSSIHWVYDQAAADHAEVRSVADGLASDAMAAIAARVDTSGAAEPAVVFNPTPYERQERGATVPAMGYAVVDLAGPQPAGGVETGPGWMANGLLRVEWDGAGRLSSIRDLEHGRQLLAAGRAGNAFHLHSDRPREYDAWDVDRSYLDDFEELDGPVEITIGGPGAVCFRRTFGASTLEQTMILAPGSRRLDFVTDVDWHERHRFLKVAFPVDIHTDRATFEIQFGHVSRPTHENTPWEQARFEVCAHRWADLSEAGYGVALLNDCKYGYDVRGNVLRLSLLRSPTAPDPECDQGRHRFTYALLPHAGDPFAGGVLEAASALNAPLAVVPVPRRSRPLPPVQSFLSVDDPGFVVVAVKRADDGSGDIVIRGYEAYGGRRRVRLRPAFPVTSAHRTDLLERPRHELTLDDDAVLVPTRPFELVTIRLVHREAGSF